jgi:hypothetical protein
VASETSLLEAMRVAVELSGAGAGRPPAARV